MTWNQRLNSGLGLILTGVTFCYWNFLFLHSKASDANIGIIANLGSFEKPLLQAKLRNLKPGIQMSAIITSNF